MTGLVGQAMSSAVPFGREVLTVDGLQGRGPDSTVIENYGSDVSGKDILQALRKDRPFGGFCAGGPRLGYGPRHDLCLGIGAVLPNCNQGF